MGEGYHHRGQHDGGHFPPATMTLIRWPRTLGQGRTGPVWAAGDELGRFRMLASCLTPHACNNDDDAIRVEAADGAVVDPGASQ
jgi:hypothetical protein